MHYQIRDAKRNNEETQDSNWMRRLTHWFKLYTIKLGMPNEIMRKHRIQIGWED